MPAVLMTLPQRFVSFLMSPVHCAPRGPVRPTQWNPRRATYAQAGSGIPRSARATSKSRPDKGALPRVSGERDTRALVT